MAEITIPMRWILKEQGEVGNQFWLGFKVFQGEKKLHTGKEKKKGYHKGQMLNY